MGYYQDYYRAEVRSVQRLTPTMQRIGFGGEDLRRFVSTDVGDERLVVVFPPPGGRETVAPTPMPDGTLDYPDAQRQPEVRSYTVRRWDPATPELVIDFVVHDGGVAAQWALGAAAGDVVYLSPAGGWYAPPADAAWQVLLADLTGLPALGRIVEGLPAGSRAHCVVEVPNPRDVQQIDSRAEVSWDWLVGTGNGRGPSGLASRLRAARLPAGPGYVWFAGEAAESRAVRQYVRRELGLGPESFIVLG